MSLKLKEITQMISKHFSKSNPKEPEDYSILLAISGLFYATLLIVGVQFNAFFHNYLTNVLIISALIGGLFQLFHYISGLTEIRIYLFITIISVLEISVIGIYIFVLVDMSNSYWGAAMLFGPSSHLAFGLAQVAAKLGLKINGAFRSDL